MVTCKGTTMLMKIMATPKKRKIRMITTRRVMNLKMKRTRTRKMKRDEWKIGKSISVATVQNPGRLAW